MTPIDFINWPDMTRWKNNKLYSEAWWAGTIEELYGDMCVQDKAKIIGVHKNAYHSRLELYKDLKGER